MKGKKLPNREFAKRFDSVAHEYDKILNPYAVSRRYREIAKFAGGSCLEVGAGTRGITSARENKNCVMSDISFEMCKFSKEKYGSKVVCCDAEKLPFSDGAFDSIVSSESIHYLNHPERFFREANRLLKKGGSLIISAANQDMPIYDKAREILRKLGMGKMYFDDGLDSFIGTRELDRLLKENNFRVKTRKRILMFPSKYLHYANLLVEKSFLNYFCAFNFIVAQKASK